jgi:hypothetical protein
MALESGTYLNDLVATNPTGTDQFSEGDNHLRLLKTTLKNTFPGMGGRAWRAQSKSTNYTLETTDNMSTIVCSATLTLSGTAATLGNGYWVLVENTSAAGIVALPGATFLGPGEATLLTCDGTNFRSVNVGNHHVFNVRGYGAKGDGVANDTTKIQAAINAAVAAGGGIVYLPHGSYLVSATLSWIVDKISLLGDSMWTSIITRATDYGDTVLINEAETVANARRAYTSISNLRFVSTTLTTNGAHIHAKRMQFSIIENVSMSNGFIGILCEGIAQTMMDNLWFIFNNLGGSTLGRSYLKFLPNEVAGNVARAGDLVISNFNFRQGASSPVVQHGIWIECSDGIWLSNGHVGGGDDSQLYINHSNTTSDDVIANIDSTNVIFDAGTGTSSYGLIMSGAVAEKAFRNIGFSNCRFLGGSVDLTGIYVAAGCDARSVTFTGCHVFGYKQNGIQLNSTDTGPFTFTGMMLTHNSASNSGVYSHMQIGAGVKHVTVTGGNYGSTLYSSTQPPTARYGISINPSAEHITINGVSFRELFWTGINIGQVSNTVVIEGCNDETRDYVYLYFDTQTAGFAVGDTVLGSSSGHTGIVVRQWDAGTAGVLIMRSSTGIFTDNETITSTKYDGSAGGSALANGTAYRAWHIPTTDDLLLIPQQRMQNVRAGATLAFDTQTADFVVGEFIRGGTSGAMALIWAQTDSGATGTLNLAHVVGTFQAGETLTGVEGGAARATGAQTTVSTVTDINPVQRDRLAILKFAQATTMTDGGNMKLNGSGSFDVDDTLTVVCDGDVWYEIGRSTN